MVMLALTVIVFLVIRQLAIKIKKPLFNPLVISVAVLVVILLLNHVKYDEYVKNVKILNDLLAYSVVALAYPLYELLPQIKAKWRSIMWVTFSGSLLAMSSGFIIAYYLGASDKLAVSILPKSVTTPIAVTIADTLNGIASISALCVVTAGTFGSVLGYFLLNRFNIQSACARGLAIGSIAHAVGTARCIEVNYEEGAYSSLALVLCGIMTSVTAPFLVPVLLQLFYR